MEGKRHAFDVIVVGAGPGGSAVAAFASKAGLKVLLLDKAEFPRDKTCGDAVSPNAVKVMRRLDLGERLTEIGHLIHGVTIVVPNGDQIISPIPPEEEGRVPSYIIKRWDLDHMLQQEAIRNGAVFRGGVRVNGVQRNSDGWMKVSGIRQGQGISFRGRVVVMAVGSNFGLMRSLGLLPHASEYGLAARAYFKGVSVREDNIHIHFNGVPLPGYGWIFPMGNGLANIGAGIYGLSGKDKAASAIEVMEGFLNHPEVLERMDGARRTSPIRGFPLRTDFHRTKCVFDGILLVGDAAGLINPFTGEGIDYALESGEIAARHIQEAFETGDFSASGLEGYDRALRDRFQRLFSWTHVLRRVYMTSTVLNPLAKACSQWPETAEMLIDILLAREDPVKALFPRTLARILRSAIFS